MKALIKIIQNIIFLAFFSVLLCANSYAASKNQILGVSTFDKNNQTEIKFKLKSFPKYKTFTIVDPNRLVVDFTDSKLISKNPTFKNHKLFKSFRSSVNSQGQLRVVFALKKKVKIKDSIISKSNNDSDYYLSIYLGGGNKKAVKSLAKAPPPAYQDDILKLLDKETGVVKYKIPKKVKKPVIIIDAGHGGKDPGTIGRYGKSKEKYITLAYAKELKKSLDRIGKFKVYLTRDRDYYIALRSRVGKARKLRADLFISLHADSSPNRKTSGLSIYTLSEKSSDKQAAILARKENKADIIGKADFSDASGDILKTLINMSQRSTMNDSATFAEIVIKSAKKNRIEVLQNTHRFAGFRVLTAPDVPSVLIELGYLSNKKEERRLNNFGYRKKVIKAITNAVLKYMAN